MNKKTQYQIQLIQSRLNQYNDIIGKLKDSRVNIQATISLTKQTNNEPIQNLLKLKQLYTETENNQKQVKNNISKCKNDLQITTHEFKQLDDKYNKENINEAQIYKDELLRIDEQTIEIQQKFSKILELAYLDKIELYNTIEFLKNEIYLQNDIISQIQIISHSSRKTALDELHKKKESKIIKHQQINKYQQNDNDYNIQLINLDNHIRNLIEFKKLLIDSEYNLDYDTLLLNKYYAEYNGNDNGNVNGNVNGNGLDSNLSFSEKIIKIDSIINTKQKQLDLLNKKYINFKCSNTLKLTEIIDNYNKRNRNKVIGYTGQGGEEYWKSPLFEKIETGNILKFCKIILKNINLINNLWVKKTLKIRKKLIHKYSSEQEKVKVLKMVKIISEVLNIKL